MEPRQSALSSDWPISAHLCGEPIRSLRGRRATFSPSADGSGRNRRGPRSAQHLYTRERSHATHRIAHRKMAIPYTKGCLAALLLLATASLLAAPTQAIEYKCSACKAVGRELYRKLVQEDVADKPPLDLRYGLDPHGKRKGRIVPYIESELRATELLEVGSNRSSAGPLLRPASGLFHGGFFQTRERNTILTLLRHFC